MAFVQHPAIVCGALLNYRADLAALGERLHAPPYQAPPRAPVLYLRPRNTWAAPADILPLPTDVNELAVGATLGLVIARPATRVRDEDSPSFVGALCVVNDACLPHAEIFRPAIKERCRDQSCPIGPPVPISAHAVTADRGFRTYVNGKLRAEWHASDCIRGPGRLLADVTAFMTLNPGDILLLGTPRSMPLANIGDTVAVEVDGVGRFENTLGREAPS